MESGGVLSAFGLALPRGRPPPRAAAAAPRQGLTLVHFQLNLSCLCAPPDPA
jgi:hypothetical protein